MCTAANAITWFGCITQPARSERTASQHLCSPLLHTCFPCQPPAGFAMAFGGGSAVTWYEPRPDFPYVRGIAPIVVSWFLSPLLAALITLVFFLIIRTFVLRRQNSTKIAFWVLPLLIFFTIFVSLLFVLVSCR